MNRFLTAPLTAVACLGFTGAAAAVPFTFTEDWESVTAPSDALPAGWEETRGDFDVTFEPRHGSNAARIVGNGPFNPELATYTGDSAEGIDSSLWQDYNVTFEFGADQARTDTSLYGGVIARQQDDGSAYGVRVIGDDGVRVQLIRITPGGSGIDTLQTSGGTSTFGSGEVIDVTFSVVNDEDNNEIDLATAFTTDDGVTRGTTFSIDFSDPEAITGPGSFGLIANAPNFGYTWDDIVITGDAVPEPASLALVGLGGAMLLGRRRKA